MKLFKFFTDGYFYGIAAKDIDAAADELSNLVCKAGFETVQEIPEEEWSAKTINMWEDNNMDTKPFKVSIKELITGEEAQLVFTNDVALID